MARIKDASIDTLKQRINIHDVVSRVVDLRQRGRDFWGLSPFANEKTPSFKIDVERNFYYCFSTSQGGDIIRFVQTTENLSFMEAVEALATRFNIPLEYEGDHAAAKEERSIRRELLEIHEYATDFFHRAFMADHPEAEACRRYWTEERGFSLDVAKEFRIGFAPVNSRRLNEILKKQSFSLQSLKDCGLLLAQYARSEDPLDFKPRFRGRLMIPICNVQGEVIAFTARQLEVTPQDDPSWQAKYINSPETPLFHKTRVLFNLERAREGIRKEDSFLMVEGQLDAIRCDTSGLRATIAPQGTAITEEQLHTLKRYNKPLDVVLDGDSAGRKAALRILPMALKQGLEVRFIPLPDGCDPDDVIRNEGAEGFNRLRNSARSPMRFAAEAILPNRDQASAAERTRAMQRLFGVIADCDSAMLQQEYLDEAIDAFGAPADAARSDFARFLQSRRRGAPSPRVSTPDASSRDTRLTTCESDLLYLVLIDNSLAQRVVQAIDFEWIDQSSVPGRLLSRVLALAADGEWEGTENIESFLETEEEANCVYAFLAEERMVEDAVKQSAACLSELRRSSLRTRIQANSQRIANTPDGTPEQRELMRANSQLKRELRTPFEPVLTSQ